MATHFSLKVRGLYLKRPASRSLDGATASAAAGGHLPNEVVELGVADFALDLLPLLAQGVEHLAASQGDAVCPAAQPLKAAKMSVAGGTSLQSS